MLAVEDGPNGGACFRFAIMSLISGVYAALGKHVAQRCW